MIPIIIICSLYMLAANIGISFLGPSVQQLWKAFQSLPSPQHHMPLPPSPSPVHNRPHDVAMDSQVPSLGYDNYYPTLAAPFAHDPTPAHNALAGPLVAILGLALGIIAISNKRGASTTKSHDSQVIRSSDPFICMTEPHHCIITGQGSLNTSPVELLVSPLTTQKIARSAPATAAPTLASTFDGSSRRNISSSATLYYPPSIPPAPSQHVSSTVSTPVAFPASYDGSGKNKPRHLPPLNPPSPVATAFVNHEPELSATPRQATHGVRNVRSKIVDRDGGGDSTAKRVHFRDTPLFEPPEFHTPSSGKDPTISSNKDPRDDGHIAKIAGLGFSDASIFETGKRDDRSRYGNPASLCPIDVGQDKPVTRPSRSLNVLAQNDSAPRPCAPDSVGTSHEGNSTPTPHSHSPLPGSSLLLREANTETSKTTEPQPRPRRNFGDFSLRAVIPPRVTQFPAPYEHIKTPSYSDSPNPDANTDTQVDAAGTIAVPPSPTVAEPCASPRIVNWEITMSEESRKVLRETLAERDRAANQKSKDLIAYHESLSQGHALKRQQRAQVAEERALKDQQRKQERELRERQRKQERDLRTQQRTLDKLERELRSKQKMQSYKEHGYDALEEMSLVMDDA